MCSYSDIALELNDEEIFTAMETTLVVLIFAGLNFRGFRGSKLLIEFTEIKFRGFHGSNSFSVFGGLNFRGFHGSHMIFCI